VPPVEKELLTLQRGKNNPESTKDRYHKGQNKVQITQWSKEKGQTTVYKTLHRKLKIEQQ
jgi:hypothetical protein